jgi:phosphoserine phosphatase
MQVLNKREGTFESYDVTLAETLGAQAGVAIQRANLIEHYLEKQQMERAMRIAREIQQDLLPHSAPSIPGFDVAGDSVPADETGGDTYDFMPLADGRWMITVADASGHGIGPALVIAETRAMLRAVSLGGADLRDTLRTANRLLAADLNGSRFVTCFLGSLDPPASAIHYASAGHGPLLFYDYMTELFRQVPGTAMPLGVDDATEYTQLNTVRFEPGDFAIIPTDGYFEAASPSGEQFGVQRLMDLARRCCDISAERMIQNFRKAVLDFSGGKKQADDMTIVVIRRNR